jgi:DNA repair exonuclease SbcCD ATPase subunit
VWCAKCDKIRIKQISGQLKGIAACFPNKNEAQAVTDQKATCPKCNEPWDGCYCSSCFYRLTPAGQIRELHNQLAAKDKRIADLTAELRNATASIWDRMAELGKAHDTIKSLTRERDEAQAEAKLVAPTAVPSAFDTDLREYVRVITQEDVGNLCINVSDGRRLLDEIDRLAESLEKAELDREGTIEVAVEQRKRAEAAEAEREEAQAACAGLTYQRDQYHAAVGFLLDGLDSNLDDKGGLTSAEWDVIIAKSRKLSDEGSEPNPSQPLLDEIDRLRRLEVAVKDDGLAGRVAVASGNKCFPTPRCTIEIYRDALLAAMKGE